MYIANHFVKVGRILYRKGDTIPTLTAEQEKWLIKACAITKVDTPVSLEVSEEEKPKRGRRKKVSDEDKTD